MLAQCAFQPQADGLSPARDAGALSLSRNRVTVNVAHNFGGASFAESRQLFHFKSHADLSVQTAIDKLVSEARQEVQSHNAIVIEDGGSEVDQHSLDFVVEVFENLLTGTFDRHDRANPFYELLVFLSDNRMLDKALRFFGSSTHDGGAVITVSLPAMLGGMSSPTLYIESYDGVEEVTFVSDRGQLDVTSLADGPFSFYELLDWTRVGRVIR
jgi:hypothetical protein